MRAVQITFEAKLERKHPRLPVYVVVPSVHAKALGLKGTAVVEGTVNGHPMSRRSIKRWDTSETSPWFVEFTTPFCRKASISVGDNLDVSLRMASSELPSELKSALEQSSSLREAWNGLSEDAKRNSAEHVHAGKSAATRTRRAAAIIQQLAQSVAPCPR